MPRMLQYKHVGELSKGDIEVANKFLAKLQSGRGIHEMPLENIVPVDDLPGAWRWKPSKSADSSIRVIFTITDDVATIISLDQRSSKTYRKANLYR